MTTVQCDMTDVKDIYMGSNLKNFVFHEDF